MVIRTIDESWQDERGGQTSFLLLGGREGSGSARLAVTWVEAPAGSEQPRHAHSVSEQAYVIVAGRGKMNVESTSFDVAPGTLILRAGRDALDPQCRSRAAGLHIGDGTAFRDRTRAVVDGSARAQTGGRPMTVGVPIVS
jgi:hypothetical protein